jgi:hypothetical protein
LVFGAKAELFELLHPFFIFFLSLLYGNSLLLLFLCDLVHQKLLVLHFLVLFCLELLPVLSVFSKHNSRWRFCVSIRHMCTRWCAGTTYLCNSEPTTARVSKSRKPCPVVVLNKRILLLDGANLSSRLLDTSKKDRRRLALSCWLLADDLRNVVLLAVGMTFGVNQVLEGIV